MPFIKYIPYGDKTPEDISTTCQREIQIWQELTMLRHVTGQNAIYARETTASYIDQVKIYFLDASKSNWRSAGLLYYYSFLNLAKAHLVANRAVSGRTLKSTSIYHGLTASPQSLGNIVDFKIEIHPPGQGNRRNIFSQFYQKLIKEPWPFNNSIPVEISEIISYCDDISHETALFHNIQKETIDVFSLIRNDVNSVWLELLVPNSKISTLQTNIGHCINKITDYSALTHIDRVDWLTAYDIQPVGLREHSLVRICQLTSTPVTLNQQMSQLQTDATNYLNGLVLPIPSHNFNLNLAWHFVPKINISGTSIKWHPLLSNYLFAFMLSSVLRYQPHLFTNDSKDSFIAEAWCNQSATTTLRYFLMDLSKQNLRIN